jgi:hypothetical protein
MAPDHCWHVPLLFDLEHSNIVLIGTVYISTKWYARLLGYSANGMLDCLDFQYEVPANGVLDCLDIQQMVC